MHIIEKLRTLHDSAFGAVERATQGWFMGLFARFAFASALMVFFLNSALTKVGSGFPGFLVPVSNAYAQMLPAVAERYGYSAANIPFFPYKLIVFAGTHAEFVLPVMIVLGLFTRLASLGMIGFIGVMTLVDIYGHGADAKAIGGLFDRVQDSAISDQRLLWLVPLVYLVLRGAGSLSLDAVAGRLLKR